MIINPFIEIVKSASESKWCMIPYCTTCCSLEYREALKKLAGELGGSLADALVELDPNEITKIPEWEGALVIALHDLPISLQVEGILTAWLNKIEDNISFTDLVLFKVIRFLPDNNSIRQRWISNALKLALKTRSFSLTESLILVLGSETLNIPELLELGKEMAKTSKQMRRVLYNTCSLKIEDSSLGDWDSKRKINFAGIAQRKCNSFLPPMAKFMRV